MHICDKTYLALSLLVDVSRESQLLHRENFSLMGNRQWFREFCTVKMLTSRMGGHTFSILKLIEEFKSSLVISPNKMLSDMKSKVFEKKSNIRKIVSNSFSGVTQFDIDSNISYFTTIDCIENFIRGSGINLEAVIVDVSNMISKNKIDKLYDLCLPAMNYNEKFFIFIQ